MPSSNKTPLGLNQWSGSDKPKREDFNSDNKIISDTFSSFLTNLNPGPNITANRIQSTGVTPYITLSDLNNATGQAVFSMSASESPIASACIVYVASYAGHEYVSNLFITVGTSSAFIAYRSKIAGNWTSIFKLTGVVI